MHCLIGPLVDGAVHLDDQACFVTVEVSDELADGVLAAELKTIQPVVAQSPP